MKHRLNWVVDQELMVDIYSAWDKHFGDSLRLWAGDSCKSHFTKVAKAKVSPKTSFARIPEGCTSAGQYLDLYHMHVFKHNYRDIFCTEVEPKLQGRKISARERRILVTRIVARAHALTVASGASKRHAHFKQLGYLPCAPADIKLRVLPSYVFTPLSDVEQKVQSMLEKSMEESADPEPPVAPLWNPPAIQKPITSFFKKK